VPDQPSDEIVTIQEELEVVTSAAVLAPVALGFDTDRETNRNEFESSFDSATSPQLAVSETIRNDAETLTPSPNHFSHPQQRPASVPTVDAAGEFDRTLHPSPRQPHPPPGSRCRRTPRQHRAALESSNQANLPTRNPSRAPTAASTDGTPPPGCTPKYR
jgi:hypothetical protein